MMACCTTKTAQLYGGNYQEKGTAGGIWVRRSWAVEALWLLETLKCSVHLRMELVIHWSLGGGD